MSGWESEVLLEDVLRSWPRPYAEKWEACGCCQVASEYGEFPVMYCEDCITHMSGDLCITEERHDHCFPANDCSVSWAAGWGEPYPWEVGMERVYR